MAIKNNDNYILSIFCYRWATYEEFGIKFLSRKVFMNLNYDIFTIFYNFKEFFQHLTLNTSYKKIVFM